MQDFERNTLNNIPLSPENTEQILQQLKPMIDTQIHKLLVTHRIALEEDDLQQEAAIALWRALQTYNPQRQIPFITYYQRVLQNKLSDYIRDKLPHFYRQNTKNKKKYDRVPVYVYSTTKLENDGLETR